MSETQFIHYNFSKPSMDKLNPLRKSHHGEIFTHHQKRQDTVSKLPQIHPAITALHNTR